MAFDITQFATNYGLRCHAVDYPAKKHTHTYNFMARKKYIVTKEDGKQKKRKHTETPADPIRMSDLSGGSFCFPYYEWANIHEQMALDYKDNQVCFWNEMVYATEGVKFFLELDYVDAEPVSWQDMEAHAHLLQEVVQQYFQGGCDVLILTSESKPKMKEGKLVVSSGMHMIFYNKIVTVEQGHQICYSCKLMVEQKGIPNVTVDDCFSTSGAHLRALGSHKVLDPCFACGGQQDDNDMCFRCPVCRGRGKCVDPTSYEVKTSWDESGHENVAHLEQLRINPTLKFQIASLVPHPGLVVTTDYKMPQYAARYIPPNLRVSPDSHAYKGEHKAPKTCVPVTNVEILRFINNIIKNFHEAYQGIEVDRVVRNKYRYFINVKGEGYNFCRILGHSHETNRVYFRIEKKSNAIYQCCHDKECSRKLSNDKELYESQGRILKKYEMIILFPDLQLKFIRSIHSDSRQKFLSHTDQIAQKMLDQNKRMKVINF